MPEKEKSSITSKKISQKFFGMLENGNPSILKHALKCEVSIFDMTVINMISFGEEGVAVADEQSSTLIRKYNVAQKLKFLNESIVYGGSGPAAYLQEIYQIISERINEVKREKNNLSLKDVYRISENTLIEYKNHLKNKILSMNLGITLDDMLTGTLSRNGKKLDESTMTVARNILESIDEQTEMGLMIGGIENKKFNIYVIGTKIAGISIGRPYCSIGSGSDESEKVLSRYVADLPRDERENINPVEGLVKIIEATNASSNLNIGVGGAPSIVYVSREKLIKPNENQCVLASELVEGLTRNLLDKDFAYDAVSRLVYKDESFEKIEEEMKQKSRDWKKLDRILRGYKE